MKTLIEDGWVVAWNGTCHEVYERGAVVYEGDRVVHAGGPYAGAVDARVSASGKLVSPGFINTHVHTTGNGGDWMLGDMVKNDHRTSNYLAFAAPLKGKLTPPPPETVAALRAYVFLHALKNGSTTIIDVGGLRGDWEGYARLVDDLGVRVYASPPFRDRNTFTDERGRLYYEADTAVGATRPICSYTRCIAVERPRNCPKLADSRAPAFSEEISASTFAGLANRDRMPLSWRILTGLIR